MARQNQYNSPTVARAIALECGTIKDILAKAHPLGLPVKDIAKKFHKKEGYLLQAHTVQTRLNSLQEKDEVHRSIQVGKYGCSLFILGPAPEPIPEPEPEPEPELPLGKNLPTEPPLAGDELLSFCFEMEKKMCIKIARLEERLEAMQKDNRMMVDHVVRTNVLVTAIAKDLNINLTGGN